MVELDGEDILILVLTIIFVFLLGISIGIDNSNHSPSQNMILYGTDNGAHIEECRSGILATETILNVSVDRTRVIRSCIRRIEILNETGEVD